MPKATALDALKSKWIVLLDVDDTCAIGNKYYGQEDTGYRYNDALFAALKACQCTEIYLFTSFNLTTVSPNLQAESAGIASRLKLIQYLENQGFKVRRVVTPLDIVFKKGIGAYYEEVIKPYEMRVLAGEDLRTGAAASAYKADIDKEMALIKEAPTLNMGNKSVLYEYFIQVQRDVLLYPHFNVVFVDDTPRCLGEVKNANQKYGYPLCTIQAKPEHTITDYQKLLLDFQYGLEREYVTQQLELIKALTLDKIQDEAYQTLQKEFEQLSSATPDLLNLRHFSMKVTYFLTQVEKPKALYSKDQKALFDNPLLQDKQAERLIADIKAMPGITELSDTSKPEATLYGLEKPYSVSLDTARAILRRINKTGNSHVGRVGNVFFKQDPKFSLVEQAVYQLSRLFGEGAVTPTRLLLLEIPKEQTYALQASLGVGLANIEAIDLDALCQIPEAIAMLKQDLGEAQLVQDFELLLTNDYYKTWLSKRNFSTNMSLEKQCTIFLESLLKLPQESWPVGLKEFCDQPEPQKSTQLSAALQEAFQYDKKAPLRILALLERYPALSKHPLNHLIACCDVFECLRFLYPKLDAKAVLKEAKSLLNYIDKTNLSTNLVLKMVSDPQDDKGDNFKAQFRRNRDGNLIAPLEIIGIDNDDAMKGVFKSKKGEHLLLVKSLLLANSALLNEPIAESVRERCLSIHPKVAIMQWLEALNHYYEPYNALKESGIIFKGLSQALLLEEQVSVDFIGRLLERLEVIQNSLKQGTITHKTLWRQVQPLLAYSYEALSRASPSSQALMTALYHKKKPVLLGNVLKADLAQILDSGKTLGDLIEALPLTTKNKGYRSYIETLTEQVSGSLTDNHPLQVHGLTLCMRLKFYHITLPPEGLILSPADLIKAYMQAPQEWVNLIKICPKISIQFQVSVLFSHPLILYYALSQPEGPLLVEALLASGIPANQVRPEDGLTPLHFAVSFYPDCIPALVRGGAQTEGTDAYGTTPLERAIHSNQHKAIILLLQAGAGRDLKAPLGLAFIKTYKKLCPELCQALLSRNIAMAWYLALETISQESPTQEVVASMGGIQNKRYLRLEIYRDIFKKGSIFPKDNIHGVRSVTAIQCQIAEGISAGLHLKKDPELPGREIMVHVLAKHLFGFITPSIVLWRFITKKTVFKKEGAYPVLASRSIKGKNLLEVLEKNSEELKKLDKQSAYQAIILAMMINPEDGRFDNYIMEPFSKGSEIAYRLVSIDNDHAFVRPIALKKSGAELTGTEALQVKTILYCLEEMRDALPSEMVKQLLANNPYERLRDWLIELQQQQQEINTLFNEKERKELEREGIYLDILFQSSTIEDIYKKLCLLQTVLREAPRTPLLGILRVVIPELWVRYAGIFSQYPTPLERFNVLTKDAFDTKVITIEGKSHFYLESTAKAAQIIKMTRSLRDEETALKKGQKDTSEAALERLGKLHAECSAIEEIAAELQQGVVERFKELPSIHQEKIVNGDGMLPGLDFGTMLIASKPDTKRQLAVLAALRGISFHVLKIRNFSTLTDEQLGALLQKNKSLLALSLEGCSGLTDAAVKIIEANCPNLEKLLINKLSWSQVNLLLPHLRVLYVKECAKLLSCEIKTPSKVKIKVARLYVENCESLRNLSVYSTELRELELQRCPKLPESQLLKLAVNTTCLQKVELVECLAMPNANFYQKYLKLLNFSLHDFSSEFVERLDAGMALSLKEVGMSAAMIQPAMIEKLQENVILMQRFKQTLFFPVLLKALKDTDPDIRNCVCETLSKLPLTVEDRAIVLPALLQTLEDTDADVRSCAVKALSNLLLLTVKDINTVLPLLFKALRDKSRTFKNGVCEALSKLPLTANDMVTVLPVLLNLLEDAYADVRISAAHAFSTLPLRSENVAAVWPVFLKALADENEKVRSHVCNALSKLPLTDEGVTVVLAALLKQVADKNKTMRSGACEALSKLSLAAKDIATVLSPLLMALVDDHAEVRSHACEALSNLPLTAEDLAKVLPSLLKALADPEPDVRGHACEALSKLSLRAKDKITVVSALEKAEEDQDGFVSNSATQALLKLSRPEGVATVAPDLKVLGDVKSSAEAVQSRLPLITTDEKIKQLPKLLEALRDENGTVSSKSAAAQALLNLPLTVEDKILVVLPTLLMSLENQTPEIRTQVLGLLVVFYPLTQQLAEACCQKFKKAIRAPIVTQSTHAEPTHQKERALSVYIHPSHQQMNVSGQGNNCGLFALVLGIKKGLDHNPQLRSTTRLPEFFDAIDIVWLRPDTEEKETSEIGMKLRQAMANALLNDAQYKARRYHNVVTACREFLEGESSALDMQAWLAVTRGYREPLKQEWREISVVLEKSYNTIEADYRHLLANNPLNLDEIAQLKEQLSKQDMDKPEPKALNALLESYYSTENHSVLGLIKLRRLYRAAWLGVTVGTGLERNIVSDCMEALFKQKILAILKKHDVSESPENLLLLSLLEKTNFDQNGALVGNGIAAREEVLSTAVVLFVENDLVHHWDSLYKNYCAHIKTTPAMLSADELGCLARCWHIGLKIQFAYGEPYTTEERVDSGQLQVTLCNPTQMHWNVVCEAGVQFDMRWESSKIIALILGIENVEYRTVIIDAINNEIAYVRRAEDCSYIVGVVSAIQETPYVLLQQGVSLSTADFNATKGLSQYFEQGFLRLNAERIYFLKGLLSKNIFESSTVVSVAKWVDELPITENRLFFDYSNTSRDALPPPRLPAVTHTRTRRAQHTKLVD